MLTPIPATATELERAIGSAFKAIKVRVEPCQKYGWTATLIGKADQKAFDEMVARLRREFRLIS